MRRSHTFLFSLGFLAGLCGLMFAHASLRRRSMNPALLERGGLVRELGLTDICLSTEANYTRHLSQADLTTAFQDHPLSLEHFPSGTWILPPPPSGYGNGHLVRPAKEHP
jgi:hypothetical protein